jgi:hypothetical protein
MTKQPQPDNSGYRSEDDIDKVLGNANPNPERVGCPSREVLAELARRARPIGDPGYEHIVNCSPCYREFRSFQQANAAASSPRISRTRLRWPMAAAALVVTATGVWMFVTRPPVVNDDQDRARPAAQVALGRTELDLRKYSVVRSEERKAAREPISLPRGRLNLTLLLPVGYEAGEYDVQLLDSNLASKASAKGNAAMRDYVATLEAELQTGELAPGSYQLAVRRHGESWQMFPVELKP